MLRYGKLPILLMAELASGEWDSNNAVIASWLLENLQKTEDISVEQLAKACYVSKAAISRFCREIGLEDFSELRELWREEQQAFPQCGAGLSAKEQGSVFLQSVQDAQRLAVDTLDYPALERLICDMQGAERVVLLGLFRSANVAMNLQGDLWSLGVNTVARLTYREQAEYLQHPQPGDVVLIFSFTGAYFDFGLPRKILHEHPKLWFIAGEPQLKEKYPGANVLSFDSKRDAASHPYQLQIVAGLIAQRYAAARKEKLD